MSTSPIAVRPVHEAAILPPYAGTTVGLSPRTTAPPAPKDRRSATPQLDGRRRRPRQRRLVAPDLLLAQRDGVLRVEPLQRLDHHARDDGVAGPGLVGRDDIPGRVRRRRRVNDLLVRRQVVAPPRLDPDVVGGELVRPLGIVEARQDAPGLLLARDVEGELADGDAAAGQQLLEVARL